MIYIELFWSFFQIGLFSIGGGYAAMPLIQNQVVDIHPWLTMTQFADIMTIAEMTPGPIAINSATFAGISLLIMALYGQRTLPNDLASLDLIAAIIFVIGIIVLRKWKPNPLWVMAGSGFAGIILYSLV